MIGVNNNMEPENKSRKRGTANGDFVLQWGSSKRLRGAKKEGNATGNASGVLRKAIRADRRVSRAGKLVRRARREPQPDVRSSSAVKLNCRKARRYAGVSSARESADVEKQNSGEPVESFAVPRADKGFPEKLDKAKPNTNKDSEIVIAENGNEGCLFGHPNAPQCLDMFLLPKFMIALSHKEKEEDFFAIKGAKLPQRPKKRAKHVQRALHCVTPGSWLCELSLDRYEVRERKSLRKKPLGLKAMDSGDSDSDKS